MTVPEAQQEPGRRPLGRFHKVIAVLYAVVAVYIVTWSASRPGVNPLQVIETAGGLVVGGLLGRWVRLALLIVMLLAIVAVVLLIVAIGNATSFGP